jgi:hypothetical protein
MSVAKARSRVAVEVKRNRKSGGELNGPAVQEARRLLAEEKIKQYVSAVVAQAPRLTEDQLARLSALFRGTGA